MESGSQWLRSYLLGEADYPVVFDSLISTWPAAKWIPEELATLLAEETIRFRIGKQNNHEIQLETECKYVNATVAEFNDWRAGACSKSSSLSEYSPEKHWCYADYKYMADMFKNRPKLRKGVDWSRLGFPDRDGNQSTFWLGSAGAYTVCHYDTYGCNLVAQIHGRKRWVLIPPDQTPMMYPSRLPYEESSIFSKVNIKFPDLKQFPKFKNVTPHIVTLSPGQVLYVPRHWWHLVESLDTSVSINTWIDMPEEDNKERLQEAISRTLAFSIMDQVSDVSWLNPTENLTDHEENMDFLSKTLTSIVNNDINSKDLDIRNQLETRRNKRKITCDHNDAEQTPLKRQHLDKEASELKMSQEIDMKLKHFNGTKLRPCTFSELQEKLTTRNLVWTAEHGRSDQSVNNDWGKFDDRPERRNQKDENITTGKIELSSTDLLDCVLQPDVIKLITEKIMSKVKDRNTSS